MTDNLRDRIAAVIEAERNKWAGGDAASETLADAVIAAPGIAVMQLPEPRIGSWPESWPVLVGGEPESVYLDKPYTDDVEVVVSGSFRVYAYEARALAAALLAAADKAEER